MSSYKVVIPIFGNEQYADQCLGSMDVAPHHILIVDNSPTSFCKKYEDRGFQIVYAPENIGVSRAWNIGLKANCDWTFLVSIAACFPNGFSEVLAQMADANEYCFLTSMSWHCNAISKKLVYEIGHFDENFYQAYYEDTDYYYRMKLAGIDYKVISDIPAYALTIANSLNVGLYVNFKALGDYYKKKWGGNPGCETFTQPFNGHNPYRNEDIPKADLKYWIAENVAVLRARYEMD